MNFWYGGNYLVGDVIRPILVFYGSYEPTRMISFDPWINKNFGQIAVQIAKMVVEFKHNFSELQEFSIF